MQDSVIRLGLIQWQMRPLKNLQDFYNQVEFFVDAVAGYQSDFCLFRVIQYAFIGTFQSYERALGYGLV